MNLLEKCQSANAKIEELVEAKKSKGVADNIRNRIKDLESSSEELLDYHNRTSLLLNEGILKSIDLIEHSKLAHQVTEMRDKLKEDPSAITSGRNFSNLKKSVDKHAEQAKKFVDETWKTHVAEVAPKVDTKLLKQHRSTSFAAVVANLETNAKDAKKLARTPPADAAVLAQLLGYWNEIRTNLARIPQADDPDVQAFLNAVGSEDGAGLDALSTVVIEWLKEHDMLDQFCIRKKR